MGAAFSRSAVKCILTNIHGYVVEGTPLKSNAHGGVRSKKDRDKKMVGVKRVRGKMLG